MASSPRAIAIRTCLGCMRQDRKDEMVRIVAGADGVKPDFQGHNPGRGGYIHIDEECFERFIKSRAREFKSLKMKIDRPARSSIVRAIKERLDRKPALE